VRMFLRGMRSFVLNVVRVVGKSFFGRLSLLSFVQLCYYQESSNATLYFIVVKLRLINKFLT